jgi:predicted nucleotidyltransferase
VPSPRNPKKRATGVPTLQERNTTNYAHFPTAPSRPSIIKYLQTQKPKFTVLIGSRARGTPARHSDIDVVRIGHQQPIPLDLVGAHREAEVCYIDYDSFKFSELYRNGSLFLHHIFTEGTLLRGPSRDWSFLRRHFRVKTNFTNEISQNRRLLRWLQSGEKFKGATMPFLSHSFRALKNLAIFSLAQRRDYVFDKRSALTKAFPRFDAKAITCLIKANDIFERSVRPTSGYKVSPAVVDHVRKQIARAIDAPT